ncbi:MAG: hypothetical protein A2178_00645 [Planctomycetes bacterium GWC2_49_10]|nr:MAG: hypothetical protein A2178_00645 [Planctomycetes bacterium GWC2_49_10]
MYKHRLTLLFRSGVFCLLAYSHILSPAHAEPTSESTVSSAQLALDQQVSITIKMTWDAAEGNYEITQKHWAPENLEFAKQKIANEAYSLAGKEWQERTYTFLFNPKKKGPAFIRDIRLSYINTKTKKPGQIKFPVELSFFVGQPIRSKF